MIKNQVLSSFTTKARSIGGFLLATLDYVVKNNLHLTKGPAQEIYDGYDAHEPPPQGWYAEYYIFDRQVRITRNAIVQNINPRLREYPTFIPHADAPYV